MSSTVADAISLPAPARAETPYIERGTTDFLRTSIALFCAGLATFTLLYCTQPLLPVFSREFGINAASSSLAISLPSIALAIGTLIASSLSETFGRKPLMVGSVFASAGLTFLSAFAPSWESFLVLRTLQGLAMGLYISGNALGGMSGRVGTGILSDLTSWHFAMGAMGALGLVTAIVFVLNLRPSRHFRPRSFNLAGLAGGFAMHLREPGLRVLFLMGAMLMGSLVTIYNFIGYRLLSPEFGLSQTFVGLIFTVYIVGILASTFIGALADRLGRARIFWINIVVILAGLAITLHHSVTGAVLGLAVITLGFFGAHAIASAWVGRRALQAKAQASSLYLFACYGGSSVIGTAGGWLLTHGGWPAVVAMVACCMLVALVGALWLSRLKPLAQPVG